MCSCNSNKSKSSQPSSYVVVLPGGRQLAYHSEVTAKAKVKATPGAYLKDAPVAV